MGVNQLEHLFWLDEPAVWPLEEIPTAVVAEWLEKLAESQIAEIHQSHSLEDANKGWVDLFLVALHRLRVFGHHWPTMVQERLRNHAYRGCKQIEEKYGSP